MARGTQLIDLVAQLRAEVGQSTKVSVGTDKEEALKQVLRRNQEMLYDEYDWPHLTLFTSVSLAAGQRYYNVPATLSELSIRKVAVEYNGEPIPIERGIDFEHYIAYDSDADERADPALRWDTRRTSATATQIEVWPIPASNSMTLWFKGLWALNPLVSNDDTADLDDILIVLTSAAEILARAKSEDAESKGVKAQTRLATLFKRAAGGRGMTVMGGGDGRPHRSGRSHIVIARS